MIVGVPPVPARPRAARRPSTATPGRVGATARARRPAGRAPRPRPSARRRPRRLAGRDARLLGGLGGDPRRVGLDREVAPGGTDLRGGSSRSPGRCAGGPAGRVVDALISLEPVARRRLDVLRSCADAACARGTCLGRLLRAPDRPGIGGRRRGLGARHVVVVGALAVRSVSSAVPAPARARVASSQRSSATRRWSAQRSTAPAPPSGAPTTDPVDASPLVAVGPASGAAVSSMAMIEACTDSSGWSSSAIAAIGRRTSARPPSAGRARPRRADRRGRSPSSEMVPRWSRSGSIGEERGPACIRSAAISGSVPDATGCRRRAATRSDRARAQPQTPAGRRRSRQGARREPAIDGP